MDDYESTFGGGAARLLRGRLLGEVLGIPSDRMPRFRDAWCERGQNPEREPGVGPLIIALYCHIDETRIVERGIAERVFDLRSNPYYMHETYDRFGYTVFRFNVPASLDSDMLGAMAARAVSPVDTDVRWATALGQTLKGRS